MLAAVALEQTIGANCCLAWRKRQRSVHRQGLPFQGFGECGVGRMQNQASVVMFPEPQGIACFDKRVETGSGWFVHKELFFEQILFGLFL